VSFNPRLSTRLRTHAIKVFVVPLLASLSFPLFAQTRSLVESDFLSRGPAPFPMVWNSYRQAALPPTNLQNGPLLPQMIHDGKLSLSLDDLLKLVVENGLDLESGRYTYLIAQTDLLRAKSGQAARGLPEAPVPGGLFAGAIGAGLGNNANVSAAGTGAAAISAGAKQVAIGPRGTFDPTFSANFSVDRVISPLNTVRVSGTPNVTVLSTVLQTRFQQELPYGTSYSISFNLQRQGSTQNFLLFDPAFTSYFSLQFYQPVLNGFGLALNRRFITFTENNRKIGREVYRQQLNNDLSDAANLYWDFVALRDQVRVAEESVAASQKLYDDDQKEVTVGVLAPLDLLQSEAQLAASRRDLVVAQTNLRMQKIKIKTAISRAPTKELDEAEIEPLDSLPQGAIDVPPLSDALESAMRNRAAIRQGELQLENQKIAEAFTHNNLLPTLSLFAQFNSYSLANGTSSTLRQIAQWVYPEYAAGFTLSFSIFNRAAQADDVRARIEYRQAEASLDQTRSQVGLAVRTALIGLIQSRAQIDAAQRAVASSQAAYRAEQLKLLNGVSTPYRMILAQRDLVAAQFAEIQTRVSAAKALVALQVAMGTFLEGHGISVDEALRGAR